MHYLDFLQQVHTRLAPRHYLEIGVRWGNSLSLSRCPSVGIDPAFAIDHELHAPVDLFRTTSDEYFARPDPLEPTGGEPFDLAFIDGLHLFEYALRDFMNTERHSRPGSMIVFDDILPRNVDEAARDRHTGAWTGDVYPVLETLARYRPDILTVCVDTQPTGLLLVMGLDPSSTVLADNYDAIMRELRHADPQPVPAELMDRTFVQAPERVLASPLLDELAASADDVDPATLNRRLREVAGQTLGSAYA
ncbi:class I SAM-dependent methyltransferase [Aeromicrobium massiliense]|uniref:class I SAM-dependent methyltransferase n=1 Tax=Aeromicrobium massiliense TaxID=1464554 RepID=UPI0002F6F59E|nr:class I SAM-dependent methyltransferase [Aeromicrobium massiliense]